MTINAAMMRSNKALNFRGAQASRQVNKQQTENKQSKNISFGSSEAAQATADGAAQMVEKVTPRSWTNFLTLGWFGEKGGKEMVSAGGEAAEDAAKSTVENFKEGAKEGVEGLKEAAVQNKWLLGGAAAVGVALIAGGAYAMHSSHKSEQQPKTNFMA